MTPAPDHPRFGDLALLGTGSMGVVYRAYDKVLRQLVALKTLPRLDPEEVYWLKSEFRALADVRHTNLAELHELVVDETHCFFTMELVDGVDLLTFTGQLLGVARTADGDPARWAALDDCVRQLVAGVRAIHDAGKLHRDIKPANILVTPERRVVLLDFGLTIPLRGGTGARGDGGVAGTFAYMAPEQAWGRPLSPKADWYSVGVVLYEALTGELPFLEAAADRRLRDPRVRAPAVPERHGELVVALLDPDPARRPGADGILDRLAASPAARPATSAHSGEEFVGRLGELHRLHRTFERTEHGAVSVHVLGESGIGKTTLVHRFTAELEADEGALVLRGRCHPHESVPYKALDGVVDCLANHLLCGDVDAAAVAPADVDALLQLFPVLGRVPELTARSEAAPRRDPVETRRRGAKALKDLLARLAATRPVVVWIDDVQWGDVDSPFLLRALLGPPDVPRLLLVVSYRSEDEATSPLIEELLHAPLERDQGQRVVLRLDPLSPAEARVLARRLLAEAGQQDAAADVAREASGSPFLIHQLARHRLAGVTGGPPPSLGLGNVVLERLATLDVRSRRILDIVSLAAAPLTPDTVLEAAGGSAAEHSRITMMQAESLLRLAPHGDGEAVRPYHDRIREAVVADIPPERLREYHRILARALAARTDPDPEALFTHYLGAGDARSAVVYLEKAAHRAAEALAFDRAASLYGTALELKEPGEDRIELLIRHGEALKNSGRTAEAGTQFREAAGLVAAREPGSGRLLGLRRSAAECFLRSGRFDEGSEILWDVMRSIGVARPSSDRNAFVRALLMRLPYMVGRVRPRPEPGAMPPETMHRLDTLWGAAMSLTMTDHPLGAFIGAKYIGEAIRTKEPWALARAIGWEAALENSVGGRHFQRRAKRLLAVMDRVVEWGVDPLTVGFAESIRGSCAWFDGCFRAAAEHSARAVDMLRTRCHGVDWEIATTQVYVLSALGFLGDMRTLSGRLDAALQDALERGDLFAANNYRVGQQTFCRLAADEPERVLALAAEAEASMPARSFHIQRYHHLTITTQCHLYRQEPWHAWEALERAWPGVEAAQFLRLVLPRAELLHLRARVALALAHWLRSEASAAARRQIGWTPEALVRHAAYLARRIRRARTLPAAPFAATIEAAVAAQRGVRERACRRLEDAVEGFRVAEMLLHREAARYWLGELVGGDAGRAVRADAERRLGEQVRRPEAVALTLAPGLRPEPP